MKKATMDLTRGKPLMQILLFAVPLVFGTLFQQLYSFADTVIIGRTLGENALGAVGVTYSLNFLVLGFVQGACVGFGIPLAQSFGGRDTEEMHRFFWNGVYICLIISVIMTALTMLSAYPLLGMIHTPPELLPAAGDYIMVIFAGLPATVLYNYTASVLRALGDSKRPFMALLISCIQNIFLDLVLICLFGMGVRGAAAATVFSQLTSGLICTWWLFTRTKGFRVCKREAAVSPFHIRKLCTVGLPMGFEYSVSAIGAVIMQNAINGMGSVIVAAQTAGEKIRQMFTLPMESIGMAMATYTGQNFGAGRYGRIRSGIRAGLLIQVVYSAAAYAVIFFGKHWLVGLVLGKEGSALVTDYAVLYLGLISTLFIVHGSLMIFRNTLQGLGYSFQAVLSGFGELAGRAFGSLLAVSGLGFTAICFANPIAWGCALCYCVTAVMYYMRGFREDGKK